VRILCDIDAEFELIGRHCLKKYSWRFNGGGSTWRTSLKGLGDRVGAATNCVCLCVGLPSGKEERTPLLTGNEVSHGSQEQGHGADGANEGSLCTEPLSLWQLRPGPGRVGRGALAGGPDPRPFLPNPGGPKKTEDTRGSPFLRKAAAPRECEGRGPPGGGGGRWGPDALRPRALPIPRPSVPDDPGPTGIDPQGPCGPRRLGAVPCSNPAQQSANKRTQW